MDKKSGDKLIFSNPSIYFEECTSENVSYLFQCGYTVARRNSLPEHFIFYISLD
jgi:hypothetical protein